MRNTGAGGDLLADGGRPLVPSGAVRSREAPRLERQGKAISNFAATLPPAESDMAAQVFKDPYLFDFLGKADPYREREIEQALVNHIQRTSGR